ncbi:MAG: cytochrome c biogenesis protein CcsA, partial [Zoogloeaceae bacterium]|nr:cytochrome c biogenesis protein CcsA [Zoogloeaceae bacterium]
ASFMPWLVGTALVHSLAVTEKRQAFRSWTVLLAIFAFSLSLLGTFLVRSGVLTSVHAFATDPRRGLFILGLVVLVVGGSLTLFAWRAPRVGLGGGFGLLSRESLLLTNNVFLAVAAASVLLGTLYPLVLDALGLGKISVGPPYFETVFVPLMVPVLVLMGVGPLVRWKQHEGTDLLRRLAGPAVAALAAGVVTPWLGGRWSPMIALGLALAFWILLATGYAVWARARSSAGLRGLSSAFWGMVLAHAGVGVFVIGVTLVSGYQGSTEVRMRIGDSADLAGYAFRFDDAGERRGPNYLAARGSFSVTRDGARVALLHPEKRTYLVQKMPMTESAIDTGVTRDLYLALGEALEDGSWIVRIWYKPFVVWIWGGCLLMALGALLAASDRRYRRLAARGVAGSEVPKVVPPALAVPRPGEA